jgi:phosphogluconate dehydratase
MVVVVRFQGPAANGMPELHKLTPVLTAMQDAGLAVALLTDGRMSGASGRVPAAIHLTPETVNGGALGRLRDGDPICLDAAAGQLNVLLHAEQWQAREPAALPADPVAARMAGRSLFSGLRARALGAEQGACTWL